MHRRKRKCKGNERQKIFLFLRRSVCVESRTMMKPRFSPSPPFHPRPPSPGCFASNFLPKICFSFSRSLSLKTNISLVRGERGARDSPTPQEYIVVHTDVSSCLRISPAGSFLAASACGDRTHLGRDGETRRKPTTDEDGFSGRPPLSLRPSAQCSFPRTVSTPTTLGGYRVLWGLFMEGQSVLAYVRVRWGEKSGGEVEDGSRRSEMGRP